MKKLISAIGLFMIGLLLLVPAVSLLVMSVKEYSLVQGLAGSPYVGLRNITEYLLHPNMGRVLGNTLWISALSLVIGAGYMLVALLSINTFKNILVRLVFTFLFALPAVIPANVYTILFIRLLPTEILVDSSVLLQVIAAAETGLRFSAVFVIAAPFVKNPSIKEALRYVLLYIAVRLIGILTLDTAFLSGFSNPLTYEHLDTYGTFSYRIGFMQAQFSLYAGGYVAGLLIKLLPAIVGVALLILLFKNSPHINSNTGCSGKISPIAVTAVLPTALLLLVIITGGSGSLGLEQTSVAMSYFNGIILAAASAIVVVFLGMLLANAALGLPTLGVCLVAFLLFISDNLLGPYFLTRTLGLFNTFPGAVLQNLHWIAPLALIAAMTLKQNYSIEKVFAVSAAALGMAFAWFWGDHLSAMVVISSGDRYPVSVVIQQTVSGQEAGQLSAILYLLVPVLVAGLGIAVGGWMYHTYCSPKSSNTKTLL